jgi:DeoR/GlpR family transcriptional regulator of sugar metabolism
MIPNAGSLVLQRRLKIADWIRRHGTMRVEALSEALGVSVVTVRSDLAYLEAQGMVLRGAGHARAVPGGDDPAPAMPAVAAVLPMLRSARRLIQDDQTILLGAGSASLRLLPLLADADGMRLILTALDAVPVARGCLDATLHLLGGEIGLHGGLSGPQSLHALTLHTIDLFIVEARTLRGDALVLAGGETEVFSAAAARQAKRTLALITGRETLAAGGLPRLPLAAVDSVLLVAPPGPETRQALRDAGFVASADDAGHLHQRRDAKHPRHQHKEARP